MKLLNPWSLILVTALSVAAAASCSAGNSMFTSSSASGGTGGATATSSTGPGGTGVGTTSSGMGGLNLTVGSGPAGTGGSTGPSGSTGAGGSNPDACDACTMAGGTCTGGSCTLSDNPGSVASGTQTMLMAGGSGDPSFAWLYPYDKTVFPRGLTSPTLQFGGTAPTSFYVHVSFPGMDYKGFYAANSVKGFQISPADWTAITEAAGPTTPVTVEVTKIAGASVAGPITETWTVAQGSLTGTIYYETYGSTILGGADSVGIMKIQPGAATPTIVKNGCGNVCHTASADGSTLVANVELGFESASYDLKTNASTIHDATSEIFTYGGIYPDGSFVVSATGYRTFESFSAPALYKTADGTTITAPGFDGTIQVTGTPAFSPDGTMMALNASGSSLEGGGSTLSVMSFDHATFTFSNGRNVANHAGQTNDTVAWPAFTPDGKWVVYHAGSDAEFETDEGATGQVFFTSSTANMQARLDALNGYGQNGTVYLPENDPDLNFAPTVLPVAVGGYFWVVFTSHRSYGNTLASMATGPAGDDTVGKLWVAAFDINATAGQDPSHPAFYLDGQETTADNLRGFWVLNPCQADGTSCTSGANCCGGFCRPGDGGADMCTDTAGGCSNLYESCTTASDCCLAGALCINNRCAQPPPT